MKVSYLISKLLKKIQIPAIKKSNINCKSKICSGSHVVDTFIDKYSYVGNYCTVNNSEIGKFCSIADNCIIGADSHPITWVSTSPVFHDGKNILKKNFSHHAFSTTKRTFLGNDVWIGANVMIKSGIKISDGAIVGMGSVVTKDIGAYEIWAGNPAKLIKKRFSDTEISKLLIKKWWNLSEIEIQKVASEFMCVSKFVNNE